MTNCMKLGDTGFCRISNRAIVKNQHNKEDGIL